MVIKSTIHVGKYTSPMDPMGYQRISWDRGCDPFLLLVAHLCGKNPPLFFCARGDFMNISTVAW